MVPSENRQTKEGIDLVGDTERVCLHSKSKQPTVAIVGKVGPSNVEVGEAVLGESDLTEPIGLGADQTSHPES